MISGGLDVASFFASTDGPSVTAARPWIERWTALVPPGAHLHDSSSAELRAALDAEIATGALDLVTAAHLSFILEFAAATHQFESRNWATVVTAYLAQLCLTDEEWVAAVRAIAHVPLTPRPTVRLRLDDLPATLIVSLHQAEGIGALRELALTIRRQARLAIDACTEHSVSYEQWLLHLALAGVALAARHFFPVSRRRPRGPVATRPVAPAAFHPAAAALFADHEIEQLQDEDGSLAEYEGDLTTAVTLGLHTLPVLEALILSTADAPWGRERAVRRAELRRLQRRFRLPPHLAVELDEALSA